MLAAPMLTQLTIGRVFVDRRNCWPKLWWSELLLVQPILTQPILTLLGFLYILVIRFVVGLIENGQMVEKLGGVFGSAAVCGTHKCAGY